MHELSTVLRIVGIAQKYAVQNGAKKVVRVVVRTGELSGMVPRYLQTLYPNAVSGTLLEGSELAVETEPASLRCSDCGTIYRPACFTNALCPQCVSAAFEIIEGTETYVKEIEIEEDMHNERSGENH